MAFGASKDSPTDHRIENENIIPMPSMIDALATLFFFVLAIMFFNISFPTNFQLMLLFYNYGLMVSISILYTVIVEVIFGVMQSDHLQQGVI